MEKAIEYYVLVALAAQKLQETVRDFIRNHGEALKFQGANVQDVRLLLLDVLGEAVAQLKTAAQQQTEKKS